MDTLTPPTLPSTTMTPLKNWLHRHGRSLLVLALGFYLPLQIFVAIALRVWQLQGGLDWDVAILNAIHSHASSTLDWLAPRLTNLGSVWTVFPIAVAIAIWLITQQRWRPVLYFTITLLGCALINRTAKTLWQRARPDLWQSTYPLPTDFSFPSGHAMTSMVFVAALLGLPLGNRGRWLVLILGGLYALSIAWTRLYLGVHYPSDIVAGWMVAIAWAVGISQLVKLNIRPKKAIE
jgi:membrane-associated phospholipid phosphatase